MGEFGSGNGDHSWLQPRWENPPPAAVAVESWRRAECATGEIVRRIQPTVVSEERRRAVVDYVQRLIRGYLRSEVFPFGSVPLKTYLPDGDIDLTALGFPNAEDTLAVDVCSILESEERNLDAEFEVKDVQYIQAEVDRLIGKDNLFKRSIILIKAWCYYESRILGAHHGLISTYALETLVLHIFHLFHSSLDGPLAVLYRFLDYYSKFDWDSYCISLHGPVAVSSLPQLVSQPPENEGGDLLLSSEFLKNCMDMFSVPSRGLDMNSRVFLKKHLNIVDPLKENNNLGRSVSKGNFYRIRSAFSYGARKLGRILLLPSESIAEEINMFFMNTLERHGNGKRPDVQGSFLRSPDNMEFDNAERKVEEGKVDRLISGSLTIGCHVAPLCEEFNKTKISNSNKDFDFGLQSGNRASSHYSSAEVLHKCTKVEIAGIREGGDDFSGRNLAGDAQDLASSQPALSTSVNEISRAISSNRETGVSPCGKAYHASHPFYCPENGRGIQKLDHMVKSSSQALMRDSNELIRPTSYETESSSSSSSCLSSNHVLPASAGLNDRSSTSRWNVHSSQNSCAVDSSLGQREDNGTNGSPESLNLLDLTGDYDTHFKSLLYTQWLQDYMLGGLVLPSDQTPSSHFRNSNYWDFYHRRSLPIHMNSNGVVPGQSFSLPGIYPMHAPFMPGAYASEDIPTPRGTGTYFPNTNYQMHRERQPPGRGRAPVFTNQMTRLCNKGPPVTAPDISAEKGRHETYWKSQSPSYSACDGQRKPVLLDKPQHSNSNMKGIPFANGYTNSHEGRLEFGSFNSVPYSYSSSELGKKLDPVSPETQGSGLSIPATTVHKRETGSNSGRTKQAYQLKDEDDFPPLT